MASWKRVKLSEKRYYTYTLAYPEEMGGHVFYVGKGTYDRMLAHEIEARRGWRGKKYDVIREIWANGYEVQKAIVFESDIEQEVLAYEQLGINDIWAGSYLTNIQGNEHEHEIREARRVREKESRSHLKILQRKIV